MPRDSSYTEEIAIAICDRLANGESLRSICQDESMPSRATVFRWLNDEPEFETRYVRAREFQAEGYADEMADIADDGSNDWMERHDKDGENTGWQLNGEAVARSKIRLEQRRWYAEKLLPKKFGARQHIEHSGQVDIGSAISEARKRMDTPFPVLNDDTGVEPNSEKRGPRQVGGA